jgi:hypothetical protein
MTQLILLTPSAVPTHMGRTVLEAYLGTHLPSFVSGTELSDIVVLSIDIVTEKLKFSEFDLMELVVNPYNRVFLYYLAEELNLNNPTSAQVTTAASVESFAQCVRTNSLPSSETFEKYFKNLSDPDLRDISKIDYILHAESIAVDLKAIPELVGRTDTAIFTTDMPVGNTMYRDYYTDEIKAIVAEKLALDLSNYGYTF